MIHVVCFKWQPEPGYRSTFGAEQVNTLRDMVARHYDAPHRFWCITDDPEGIDAGIDVVDLWSEHGDIPNPSGKFRNPSCYRRLRLFADDVREWIGERIVWLDLDCVICGDLRPVWDRPEDFVAWGDTNRANHYNGSMILHTAGARRELFDEFDPERSPREAFAAGFFGSDQGWISYRLGPGEAMWTTADGVYSYRKHIKDQGNRLPSDARVVFFHGHHDPWDSDLQRVEWVRRHYR